MAAPHQNEGPHLAPSRQRLNKSADGSGAIGDTTKLGTGAEPEGNTRIPNRCRGGQLADGRLRKERSKSQNLSKKENQRRPGRRGPPVGRQPGDRKNQPKLEFSFDTGRPSHVRRGDAEE